MCIDLLVFFLYKMIRRDLRHFLRLEGKLSVLMSVIMRVIAKFVNDFTAMPHLRHPHELGGFYWTFCLGWNLATTIYVLFIRGVGDVVVVNGEEEVKAGITDDMLNTAGQVLILIWLASVFATIGLSHKDFRHTFFNLKTGNIHMLDNFLHGNDEARMHIFTKHENLWRPFADLLKTWLEENWDSWYESERDEARHFA